MGPGGQFIGFSCCFDHLSEAMISLAQLIMHTHINFYSDSVSAEDAAQLLFNHFWTLSGFPKSTTTNRDPTYDGAVWREFTTQFDMLAASGPERGQTEPTNSKLVQCLLLWTSLSTFVIFW